MNIDLSIFLKIITAFVSILLLYSFSKSCDRLDIAGKIKNNLMAEALITIVIGIAVIFYSGENARLPVTGFIALILLFSFYFAFSKLGLVLVKGLSYKELVGLMFLGVVVTIALFLMAAPDDSLPGFLVGTAFFLNLMIFRKLKLDPKVRIFVFDLTLPSLVGPNANGAANNYQHANAGSKVGDDHQCDALNQQRVLTAATALFPKIVPNDSKNKAKE